MILSTNTSIIYTTEAASRGLARARGCTENNSRALGAPGWTVGFGSLSGRMPHHVAHPMRSGLFGEAVRPGGAEGRGRCSQDTHCAGSKGKGTRSPAELPPAGTPGKSVTSHLPHFVKVLSLGIIYSICKLDISKIIKVDFMLLLPSGSHLGIILSPRGHWAMCDVFGCHTGYAPGIEGLGAREAAQLPAVPRAAPRVSRAWWQQCQGETSSGPFQGTVLRGRADRAQNEHVEHVRHAHGKRCRGSQAATALTLRWDGTQRRTVLEWQQCFLKSGCWGEEHT